MDPKPPRSRASTARRQDQAKGANDFTWSLQCTIASPERATRASSEAFREKGLSSPKPSLRLERRLGLGAQSQRMKHKTKFKHFSPSFGYLKNLGQISRRMKHQTKLSHHSPSFGYLKISVKYHEECSTKQNKTPSLKQSPSSPPPAKPQSPPRRHPRFRRPSKDGSGP